MRREIDENEQLVKLKVKQAAQRKRETEVLTHWKGRCVAVDFAEEMYGTYVLNDSCPMCIDEFEPGMRIWRLHCSHAGCDVCMEAYMKPKALGGDAGDDLVCFQCRGYVLDMPASIRAVLDGEDHRGADANGISRSGHDGNPDSPSGGVAFHAAAAAAATAPAETTAAVVASRAATASSPPSSSAVPRLASSSAASTSPPGGASFADHAEASGADNDDSLEGRLFVRLTVDKDGSRPFRTESETSAFFSKFGRVADVYYPKGIDANTKLSGEQGGTNFCFVTFEHARAAQQALASTPLASRGLPILIKRCIGKGKVAAAQSEGPSSISGAASGRACSGAAAAAADVGDRAASVSGSNRAEADAAPRQARVPGTIISVPLGGGVRQPAATGDVQASLPPSARALPPRPPPRPNVSLAVYLSDWLGRPRRQVVNAVFAAAVPVFDFVEADVQAVLAVL